MGVFRRLQSSELYDAISTSHYYRHYLCSKLECHLFGFDIETIAMPINRGELKDILSRWPRHLSPAEGTQTSLPYMKHGIAVTLSEFGGVLGLATSGSQACLFSLGTSQCGKWTVYHHDPSSEYEAMSARPLICLKIGLAGETHV